MFDFKSNKNKHSSSDAAGQNNVDVADAAHTIARLERALEHETVAAESLRADLVRLRDEIARIEAAFQRQLAEATARRELAEAKLADQSARLDALGRGREHTMLELREARTELARVRAERDRLQRELAGVANMQTETLALPDEERQQLAVPEVLPTLEELMANWSMIEDGAPAQDTAFEATLEGQSGPDEEMIPADAVLTPDDFGDDHGAELNSRSGGEPTVASARPPRNPTGNDSRDGFRNDTGDAGTSVAATKPAPARRNSSVLVFLEADPPIKFPLYKEVTTIGRSESADIRVDGDFISRVHARILSLEGTVTIEDAGSKNGIEVNGRPVLRHTLRHGDVLSLGTLHFTYIDLSDRL